MPKIVKVQVRKPVIRLLIANGEVMVELDEPMAAGEAPVVVAINPKGASISDVSQTSFVVKNITNKPLLCVIGVVQKPAASLFTGEWKVLLRDAATDKLRTSVKTILEKLMSRT